MDSPRAVSIYGETVNSPEILGFFFIAMPVFGKLPLDS